MKMRLVALLFLLAVSVNAQRFDPNPEEPGAKEFAEFRYMMASVGLMSPPIGWMCQPVQVDSPEFPGVWFGWAECEPDPALIAEQELERKRWIERIAERTRYRRRR